MALFSASYADFRTSLSTWADWTDSTTTNLNDLIQVGENVVYKRLRVRQMETALAATIATAGTATVPTDYLELKHAYINATPVRKLERKNAEWIYEKYPNRTSGNELYTAREGSNFIFGPAGTQGHVMTGIYYAKPTGMASGSTINSVFSAHPEVFLFGTLSELEPFIGRDARIPVWKAKFEEYLAIANSEDKAENVSGSRLTASLG